MDLDHYLTASFLDTFAETLGTRYHNVDVIVIVVVGVIGAHITVPGNGVGLCVAIFMVVPGYKSVERPCGVFASGWSIHYMLLFLV